MPIKVSWDNEAKTIVRYDFSGPWTWEEFHRAVDAIHALVKSVPHTVDYIANVPNLHLPQGTALSHIRRAIRTAPPNSGVLMVTDGGLFVNAIIGIVSRVGGYVRTANTIEDARAKILERQARRAAKKSQANQVEAK